MVGSGGFGITYEAEDINLGTMVAIKEYYPFDFGDRDATMSVRARSPTRHEQTVRLGPLNFLQEARTLARFEHPSIVRVTRVFEANSTAYMVMRFEQGQSFEAWLEISARSAHSRGARCDHRAPARRAADDARARTSCIATSRLTTSSFAPTARLSLLDFGAARRRCRRDEPLA